MKCLSYLGFIFSITAVAHLLPSQVHSQETSNKCNIIGSGVLADGVTATTSIFNMDSGLGGVYKFIQFDTRLPVTTDGAPDAFSSKELSGTQSLNRICNAIVAYKIDPSSGLRRARLNCKESEDAFAAFMKANWVVPKDVEILWRAGLSENIVDGKLIPCVYKEGIYEGFFATKTALTNGIKGDAGDCSIENQVNPREVPGLTIQVGRNFLRESGVQLGDLVLAVNQASGITVPAVIIDSGGLNTPAMGTIALNASLTSNKGTFSTRRDVLSLDIKKNNIRLIIIPGTQGFQLKRPYTKENIAERFDAFAKAAGFPDSKTIVAALAKCAVPRKISNSNRKL